MLQPIICLRLNTVKLSQFTRHPDGDKDDRSKGKTIAEGRSSYGDEGSVADSVWCDDHTGCSIIMMGLKTPLKTTQNHGR